MTTDDDGAAGEITPTISPGEPAASPTVPRVEHRYGPTEIFFFNDEAMDNMTADEVIVVHQGQNVIVLELHPGET